MEGDAVEVVVDETPRAYADAEVERSGRAEERTDRYTDRAARAHGRSEAAHQAAHRTLDSIPFGQPILVGHHSEGADRRRRERAVANLEKSWGEAKRAAYWERRAAAADGYQAGREHLGTTLRRIERMEADLRRLERALAGREGEPTNEAEAAWRRRVEADIVQLTDGIAYWRAHVAEREAAGEKMWGPSDFRKGDLVLYAGSWYPVVRVNRKTLTIPSLVGGSWTDTLPYNKVSGRRPASKAVEA